MSSMFYGQGSEDGELVEMEAIPYRASGASPFVPSRRRPSNNNRPSVATTTSVRPVQTSSTRLKLRSLEQPAETYPETPAFGSRSGTGFSREMARLHGGNATVNQPVPAANMVTASQEQRGISHGPATNLSAVDSRDALPKSSRRQGSQPQHEVDRSVEQVRSQTLEKDGVQRSQTLGREDIWQAMPDDPYQTRVNRIERVQEEEDHDYQPSQENAQREPFHNLNQRAVEQEEIEHLQGEVARMGPSSRRSPKRVREEVDAVDETSVATADPAGPELDPKRPSKKIAKLQQPRTPSGRCSAGVRHQAYEAISAQTRAERDAIIDRINRNWQNPPLFWPRELTPRGEVCIQHGPGDRPVKLEAALKPHDVSSKLLAAVERLSSETVGEWRSAQQLMSKAYYQRVKSTVGPTKLLPQDLDKAIELVKEEARHLFAGPSHNEGRRTECTVSALSGSASHHGEEMMDIDRNRKISAPQQVELVEYAAPGLTRARPPNVEAPLQERRDSARTSPDLEFISENPVKLSSSANGPTWSATFSTPCAWNEASPELEDLYCLMAKKAQASGKKLVVSFGLAH